MMVGFMTLKHFQANMLWLFTLLIKKIAIVYFEFQNEALFFFYSFT